MKKEMRIDRKRVREIFRSYTDAYDSTDEKIKLKIGHTYRVADLCERIAASEGMSDEDIDLAWLLGMLHDVGRFEQLRRYNTFIDAESVDHAKLGADILFGTGAEDSETAGSAERGTDSFFEGKSALPESPKRIRDYLDDCGEDLLIETAVREHSAYRLPQELDLRTAAFCHILRDADKIDILRVNVETPLEEIYNTTTEELRYSVVTEEVMKSFYEHHAVLRALKKTPADHVVGHISLVYELVFPESKKAVKEQGYLDTLLHFRTDNPETEKQFLKIREEMGRFLAAEQA